VGTLNVTVLVLAVDDTQVGRKIRFRTTPPVEAACDIDRLGFRQEV
jgi:hypothetical protein